MRMTNPGEPPTIPERYGLRDQDGVRFVECDEAPRVRVVIEPGMSVSRSEAAALGERTILLDGAGSFGPLIDNERKLYNLDHHSGCERLFTLATCEQALLLVQSGLELSEGDWTIYANEPDLDTVLAIWCLLNHRRLRILRPEARDVLMPLVRLEGAIDAHGPDLSRSCGLPGGLLERTRERLDELIARERRLRQDGEWATKNVHAYTIEMLRAVDAIVYSSEDFGDHTRIEAICGHVEISPKRVAVACRDRSGIYQVEQHLKSRWGEQLGLIVLENQPGQYTLRRPSSLVGPSLERAYTLLNRLDPAVDGRPAGKRWGGSHDIGGSPRPDGSRLDTDEILEILARAYRPTTRWARMRHMAIALGVGLALPLCWAIASLIPSLPIVRVGSSWASLAIEAQRLGLASVLAIGLGAWVIRVVSRQRPWAFGWRAPANGGGEWLVPLAALAAWPAVAWGWSRLGGGVAEVATVLLAGASGVVAVEVWYRGLVHGLLAVDHAVQEPRGVWRLSRAALVSSLAYALTMTGVVALAPRVASFAPSGWTGSEVLASVASVAFGTGLALAVLRERSLSLLPGIAIQLVGLLVAVGVARTLL
jgi:hypothetical protein